MAGENRNTVLQVRVTARDAAMYRRQADAAGLSLAEWVRAALDRAAAPPSERPTSTSPPAQPDHLDQPPADRIAGLAALPGLRRASELAPPQERSAPLSAADQQRLTATTRHLLEAGTEPDVIVAQLAGRFPASAVRAALARLDGAA